MSELVEIGKFVGAFALSADELLEAFGNADFKTLAIKSNQIIALADKIRKLSLENQSIK